MHPDFARVVDPVFAYVLNLLYRIDRQDHETPAAEVERDLIKQQLAEAENRLDSGGAASRQWELCRYALAVWTDEVLINANWPGSQIWVTRPLEFELFGTNDGAEEYYLKARESRSSTSFDALEVFYLGVMLGFQGFYSSAEAAERARRLELPENRETWAQEIAKLVGPKGEISLTSDRHHLSPCSPLASLPHFVGALALAVVMLLVTALTLFNDAYNQSQSEEMDRVDTSY